VNGIVQRFERGNIVVNLGRTDAVIPQREQIQRERYRQGDRVRAMILDIDPAARGPQVILTRSHPEFMKKLFEIEVPEISERIVEIKNVAREPGERAKIAVYSSDTNVDPVGACVGIKGSRVQAVVAELRGERIDIVTWTHDFPSFVARSLSPADVVRVVVDEDEHAMEVVVADDQLSLAIGRQGQNVKLASKLTGWRIDVRSESVAEEEAKRARDALESIPGIGFGALSVPEYHVDDALRHEILYRVIHVQQHRPPQQPRPHRSLLTAHLLTLNPRWPPLPKANLLPSLRPARLPILQLPSPRLLALRQTAHLHRLLPEHALQREKLPLRQTEIFLREHQKDQSSASFPPRLEAVLRVFADGSHFRFDAPSRDRPPFGSLGWSFALCPLPDESQPVGDDLPRHR